jgi:hypothetical protein
VNMQEEVRTRRLIILDDLDRERIVAEVVDGVAELRMDLPASSDDRTGLLLFAHPGDGEFQFVVQLSAFRCGLKEMPLWS